MLVGWAEFTVRNPLRPEQVEKLMPNRNLPASGPAASAARSTDKPDIRPSNGGRFRPPLFSCRAHPVPGHNRVDCVLGGSLHVAVTRREILLYVLDRA